MDRIQARAFEGFVTESGDTLLRMATLLTADHGRHCPPPAPQAAA